MGRGRKPGVGVGEGTLILPYKRRFGPFLGFQIMNFNIFFWGGGFRKMNILGDGAGGGLGGFDATVDIFRGP